MKKNTYKLLIVMVIALTMFCFGNKTSYTILENSKELYYANNIVITESISDSTIKTLFENVVAGESLTIRGTIELNNLVCTK